ncbi:MAG: hypothetical protein M1818_006990 [Claussenomyces sp. TS43310]|nr:MAG: hypothetical protein M1818_006990 [Claussenomyces sp. TS43310]
MIRNHTAALRSAINPRRFQSQGSGYCQLLLASDPELLDYGLLTVGVVAAVAAGIPFPLLGILFGQLVDNLNSTSCSSEASASSLTSSVVRKVLIVVYVAIANFVLIYVHTACWSLLGERLVRRLRKCYLRSLLRQELAFFDRLPSGEVASRLDSDLQVIQTGASEKVGICISSFSYFIASYIVCLIKSARLAGILFPVVPAFILMTTVGGHYTKKYTSSMTDHIASATSIAAGGLSNMAIVHAFGANARLETLFAASLGKAQLYGMKKNVVSSIQMGCLYFIAYSANALAFWQGSKEIAASVALDKSGTTVGNVYTVIFLLIDSSFIISQVAPFIQLFSSAAAAFSRLVTTIERIPEIDGTAISKGNLLEAAPGRLEFRNVTFSYPSRPDTIVLRDISLVIPANEHTAIVGLSGSGKSTVGALIERLYDTDSGEIILDDQNIRELNVRSLRGMIGTVEQSGNLLERSIFENIAYGLVNSPMKEHAGLRDTLLGPELEDLAVAIRDGCNLADKIATSSEEVKCIWRLCCEAATHADAIDFIEDLPHGLATAVGAEGNLLSGGQKQRIVLARALVRNPSILLLDEATASLDSASERQIQSALEKITHGRTTITIAHRLSTIKNAHQVIVMDMGRIVEQGKYTELLAKGGAFAKMVHLQGSSRSATPAVSLRSGLSSSDDTISKAETIIEQQTSSKDRTSQRSFDQQSDSEKANTAEPAGESAENTCSQRSFISSLLTTVTLARPHLIWMLLGTCAAVIVGGTYSGEAVIFGHTVGSLSPCRGAANILTSGSLYGLLFFILGIVEFAANVISASSFGRVAEKLLYRVRVMSLRSLFYQDIQWHESEGRSAGMLISYISSDANSMSGLTGTVLGVILSIIVSLVSGIILAHIIAWKIAIVLLATVPILLASGFLRLKIIAQFHQRHQKAFAGSVSIATEAVRSMKTIATFSLEQTTLHVFTRSLRAPYKESVKAIVYGNFWLASAYSISNLIYALAYYWGAKEVANGNYNQTQFFTVLPALLFSAQLCGQMFSLAPDVSKAGVAAARVLDLIDIGPQETMQTVEEQDERDRDLEAANNVVEKRLDIRRGITVTFRGVFFSYPSRPDVEVLRGLDLNFEAGKFYALVGPSGAGKSTIISLIERFYVPHLGGVKIDGRDHSQSSGVSFRDDIALVPQQSVLFDGTVRFNVALGARPAHDPCQNEIETACRLANIHDTIASLPQGYETPCGASGNQFSGGQLQRLSIARALLRKPRLLLLDEPTSALDAESERLLQEALERTAAGITVVAIAHRLHTVRHADCIFLIDAGICVDQGRHEDLLARSDWYRASASHQALDR